jgi:hypothetical protein
MGEPQMILAGKHGPVELSADTIAALKLSYATKNIDLETARAALWLERNPSRRPVRMLRFLETWLKRSDSVIRPAPIVAAWWTTEARTVNFALGLSPPMTPRAGESMGEFRDRISARLAEDRTNQRTG